MKNHEINNEEVRKKHISTECTEDGNELFVVIVLTSMAFLLVYHEGSHEMIEVYNGYGFVWYNIYLITAFALLLSDFIGKFKNRVLQLCSRLTGLIGFYLSIASMVLSLKVIYVHLRSDTHFFNICWMFNLLLFVCMNVLFHTIIIYNSFRQTRIQYEYMQFMTVTRVLVISICAAVWILTSFWFWFTSPSLAETLLFFATQGIFVLLVYASVICTYHGNERPEFLKILKLGSISQVIIIPAFCLLHMFSTFVLSVTFSTLFRLTALPFNKIHINNMLLMTSFITSHQGYLSLKLHPKRIYICEKKCFREKVADAVQRVKRVRLLFVNQ